MKNAYEDVIILYTCTKNQGHMVYAFWDMGATHNFLSFWVIFCPFTPLLAPKIKNLKKIRRYFLFCMCTINKDSWDIMRNRQKFLSFLVIFIPLTNQKSQFWEKKPGDIISLHLCTTNDNHMMYGSLDIRCNRQNFLWTIFCPFNPSKNLENKYF